MSVQGFEFGFSAVAGPLRRLARDQNLRCQAKTVAEAFSFFRAKYRFTSAHTTNSWVAFFFNHC
jgi:hypothetical protein